MTTPRMRIQTKGDLVRGQLIMPNGRRYQCVLDASSPEALIAGIDRLQYSGLAGDDDELAGFFDKIKKAAKKVGKGIVKGVKAVHAVKMKVIGPIEKKVQQAVGKVLPFTKPFIDIHNKVANPVHKALATGKVKKSLTAKAIVEATKSLPAAARGTVQAAVAKSIADKDKLKNLATAAVKKKVLAEAVAAAKKGDPKAKAVVKGVAQAKLAQGVYTVTSPSGKVTRIPASKVA